MAGGAATKAPGAEIRLSPEEILGQSFELALKAHRAGQILEAEQLYHAILAVRPGHADALHGLGVLAHLAGRDDIAEHLLKQATAVRDNPTFRNNLGLVLLALDKPAEALAEIGRALDMRSAYPEAHNAFGAALMKQGAYLEAIASFDRALALRPAYVDAHVNLGKALFEQGDWDAAAERYEKALALDPLCPEANNNYGNYLRAKGQVEEALLAFERCLKTSPINVEAHVNQGAVFVALRKHDQAVASFRCALAIRPDFEPALGGLGSVLSAQGKLQEALDCFERIVRIHSASSRAHNDVGVMLMRMQRTDEATAAFERAIELADGAEGAVPYYNLGTLLLEAKKADEAIDIFEKTLALNPLLAGARNNLGCALIAKGKSAEAVSAFGNAVISSPTFRDAACNRILMMNYVESVTNQDLLDAARQFGESLERGNKSTFSKRDRNPNRKLKIGYVSGDFIIHPVAMFLMRVLVAHDRSAFEIFAYSNDTKEDGATYHLRRLAGNWRSIASLNDGEAADLIGRDEIDILVDLSGHTGRNRLPLFARKAAPVQASWLGYFATTGVPAMDYIILDPVSAPAGSEHWYTEQVVRLPYGRFCYLTPPFDVKVTEPPCMKRGHVTFGSFNNVAKISSGTLKLWAAILHAVPSSRLLLKWRSFDEASTIQRFLDAFAEMGVSAERIETRGESPYDKMLAEYADVDIALDPFPFGGGTTSCEALWMGVPVVTLPGERLASRQTLGFLTQMGLTELAAASPEDYVARAVALAKDSARLAELRRKLRPIFEASPICDGPKFTATLEHAYRQMWRRFVAAETPIPMDIGLRETMAICNSSLAR